MLYLRKRSTVDQFIEIKRLKSLAVKFLEKKESTQFEKVSKPR